MCLSNDIHILPFYIGMYVFSALGSFVGDVPARQYVPGRYALSVSCNKTP